ncbi:hypothetical protein [Tannerella forsythia]|uniref:hypothetical protein n=1 Tax=Tannerella forsythia TaxID=28112 RepID=UPI0028EE0221|nr:hypothetical protein [Tannerella forsythia]
MTGSEPDFGWFGGVFRYVRSYPSGSNGTTCRQVSNYPLSISELLADKLGTTHR